jgi:hypothetical protein
MEDMDRSTRNKIQDQSGVTLTIEISHQIYKPEMRKLSVLLLHNGNNRKEIGTNTTNPGFKELRRKVVREDKVEERINQRQRLF